jgi:hypothetical protein
MYSGVSYLVPAMITRLSSPAATTNGSGVGAGGGAGELSVLLGASAPGEGAVLDPAQDTAIETGNAAVSDAARASSRRRDSPYPPGASTMDRV